MENCEVKCFRASAGFSPLFGKSFWTDGGLNLIWKKKLKMDIVGCCVQMNMDSTTELDQKCGKSSSSLTSE
jgi:hypothetical protein